MPDLAALYQQFDPLRPLGADPDGDALYVDWQKELAPQDVKPLLANSIALSGPIAVTRLFTGHRGVGKTTELMRVKRMLEQGVAGQKWFVSLLLAEEWVDLQDVSASEIIFQVARQLVIDLKDAGLSFGWEKFTQFFREFHDLLGAEVELKSVEVGPDPLKFGLTLKQVPGARPALRRLLEGRLPTLYDLINQVVLAKAQEWLKTEQGCDGILIIVDQLDRIPRKVINGRGLTNHENLYLDSSGILRALNCHVVYTAPIELVHSHLRPRLQNLYGEVFSLPVIPVIDRQGRESERGLKILRQIVANRAKRVRIRLDEFFADTSSLDQLCRLSGGHVRTLCNLVRSTLELCGRLPVPPEAAAQTGRTWAADLAEPLNQEEWALLRRIHQMHEAPQEEKDKELLSNLLGNMYVLAYRDEQGSYCDWNPLLGLVSEGGGS
jgi:Cdc6-like AAA superfamily ATPase